MSGWLLMEPALVWAAGLAGLAAGGALGAVLRLHLSRRLGRRGVLVANTTSALVLGFTLGLALPNLLFMHGLDEGWTGTAWMLVASLVSGLCLALGTWSTVAGHAADAVLASRWGEAARLWAAHLGVGMLVVAAGWGLGLGSHVLLARL